MIKDNQKLAFLFPGQGAQYPGMGKDFFDQYSIAKETFQQADDLLHFSLSKLIFSGSLEELTLTKNAQTAIFVVSLALLRVLKKEMPNLELRATGGLSLGEYTALVAAGKLTFEEALLLVKKRAELMHNACERHKGTMAAVLGMDSEKLEKFMMPLRKDQVYPANFNTPGQVVISGTFEGVEKASRLLKEEGVKEAKKIKVIPLKVHGAFHSGLMEEAQISLAPEIEKASFLKSSIAVVMNVIGGFVEDTEKMKEALILQIVNPVRWQHCVETLDQSGIDLFIEIGPGKTLSAMNKKIGVKGKTLSLEKVSDLELIHQEVF